MGYIAHKALSRGKYCLVFQNIQHRTEYSHLCLPPGLQSLDSAQMSN